VHAIECTLGNAFRVDLQVMLKEKNKADLAHVDAKAQPAHSVEIVLPRDNLFI